MEITENSIVIHFYSLFHLAIIFILFLIVAYILGAELSWKSFSKKVGRLGKNKDNSEGVIFVSPTPEACDGKSFNIFDADDINCPLPEKITKDNKERI